MGKLEVSASAVTRCLCQALVAKLCRLEML